MKSKVTILLQIVLLGILSCTDEPGDGDIRPKFIKYYGGEGDQFGVDVEVVTDGFVILGNSISSSGRNQFQLTKTDFNGNEIFTTLAGGNNVVAKDMVVESSGNIVVAAEYGTGLEADLLFMRFSPTGGRLDSVLLNQPNEEEHINKIIRAQDGSILSMGTTTAVDEGKSTFNAATDFEDIYALRLNPDFTPFSLTEWRNTWGYEGVDRGVDVIQKPDGTFVYFATTNSRPNPFNPNLLGFNMIVFPIGLTGDPISTFEREDYGQLSAEIVNDFGSQMITTVDGGRAFIGTSQVNEQSDAYLTKVLDGNFLVTTGVLNSSKQITGKSIAESETGGFLVLGEELISGTTNIYLGRTDPSGSLVWEQTFGFSDNETAAQVKELPDRSILVLGTADLESQRKICLIKVNRLGEL